MPVSLGTLGGDILLEVVAWLSRFDLLSFVTVSKTIYSQTISVLYRTVELNETPQCCTTLNMLYEHPDIARHVQKLVVRQGGCPKIPQSVGSPATRGFSHVDPSYVCAAVKRAATRLDALQSFVWGGEDYPWDDDIWLVLRQSCPQLKSIGVGFGALLPGVRSHLFDFMNLESFSLRLEPAFYNNGHSFKRWMTEIEPTFNRLWDMLIRQCPDLRELSILTQALDPINSIDARTLFSGDHWPRLRSLELGNVTVGSVVNDGDTHPFISFLSERNHLRTLRFSGDFTFSSTHFARLPRDSLQALRCFSGSIDHLSSLPNAKSLLSMEISNPLILREVTPLTMSHALQTAPALRSLKVSFVLQSGYDGIGILRSIATAGAHIKHLDLTFSHKPSFYLEIFSRTIRSLYKLRTLNLTVVKVPGDESMADGAVRIARSNPGLRRFSIRYIPRNYYDQPAPRLPRTAGQLASIFGLQSFLEIGKFELTCDRHGLPVMLYGREWKERLKLGGLVKRYEKDMRPPGHPGVRKLGFAELMVDGGAAGRELRMLVFSMALVVISTGAILAR
ncbi:hypothetical protein BDM02DRAFT_3087451 [Thelephora ganbajun]|uniref:Uncharacterized protein n=1 Tax=Thelephora ganbajun TaxID=370292 RepID=A0ACB6ZV51_THEGA|nr:hypothetical protein BDM02DRAFT_3087451 [Thelephora ganbajun]